MVSSDEHRIWSCRSLNLAVQTFVCSSGKQVLGRGTGYCILGHCIICLSEYLRLCSGGAGLGVACTEARPVRWIGGGSGSKRLSARQRWSHVRPTHVGVHIASGPVPTADLLSRLDHATRRHGEDLRRQ